MTHFTKAKRIRNISLGIRGYYNSCMRRSVQMLLMYPAMEVVSDAERKEKIKFYLKDQTIF